MNLVTRMDSYFTNLTMPWEKRSKENKTILTEEAVATVGALQHFRIVTKPDALTQEEQW